MSNLRIRGQEAFVDILVEGVGALGGSFTKVTDLSVTPRIEQPETEFLGETFTDLDQQVNGYDFSFTLHHVSRDIMDYLAQLQSREELHLAPANVSVSVSMIYREPGTAPLQFVLSSCVLKPDEISFGGRTEYVSSPFSGKAKRLTLL